MSEVQYEFAKRIAEKLLSMKEFREQVTYSLSMEMLNKGGITEFVSKLMVCPKCKGAGVLVMKPKKVKKEIGKQTKMEEVI